jgi:hypothetical protein
MELPWNICPYCGTPTPGMRREGATLEDVIQNLPPDETQEANKDNQQELSET